MVGILTVYVRLTDIAGKEGLDVIGKNHDVHGDWNDFNKLEGVNTAVWYINKANRQMKPWIQIVMNTT